MQEKIHNLNLNIYGVNIECQSHSFELISLLSKDFQYFKTEKALKNPYLYQFYIHPPPFERLSNLSVDKHSANSMTTDQGNIRYNNYYGKALSVYDLKAESCQVFSENINILHELSYLIILSRSGKKLETQGMHKVHAFGVSKSGKAIIGMMPMKGGKTTTFLELLKYKDLDILSDDTPIVNAKGYLLPFPLRIGIESNAEKPKGDKSKIYSIERSHYGKKILFPIDYFENQVSGVCSDAILIDCKRWYNSDCALIKVKKYQMISPLVKNMLVGVGLPLIIEYFLELTLKDFFKLSFIFIRRLSSMSRLLLRSKCYRIYLGNNPKKNAQLIYSLL